jgi:hypothetical protein
MPMNPEYLGEAALLLLGIFLFVVACRLLFTRQPRKSLVAVGVSLACFSLAFVLAKTAHKPPKPPFLLPAAKNSMSLVLGGVVVRVATADHYVLSVDNRQFLELALDRSRLRVSCSVGSGLDAATSVVQNTFPVRTGNVLPSRSTHTIRVQLSGKDVLKVHYAEPLRIEVTGEFFERTREEESITSVHLISLEKGIEWPGGRIPSGTTIDLSSHGAGRIDFGPANAVRVVPKG